MPYSGPNDTSLPDRIKRMPEAVRSRFVGVWNGAHDNCRRDGTGGPDCEGYAFRVANAAIKEVGGVTWNDYDAEYAQKRQFSAEERERLAGTGQAMPDGSYPIVTREDLSNAIQAIGRASNRAAAMAHIKKRARAMGMTEMLPEEWKSVDDDKAAHGNEGLMRRAMRAMQSAMTAMRSMMGDDGEHQEMATQPAARAVTIAKDSKGSWRWLAVVSNQFRDRDGEIITEKAHQDFVRGVAQEEIPHPELWLWHTPGTRVGKSDLVAYSDGFLLASGTFDDAATAERLSGIEAGLGVSHGFQKQQTGTDITAYRTFEVSLLPHEWAANPWTAVDFSNKERDMALTDEQRAFLSQALGEEKAREIEATLPAASDKLKAAGVDFKGIDAEQIVEAVKAAIDVKALSDMLKGIDERTQTLSTAQEEANKGLKDLLTRVEKLERSDDQKIAATLAPRKREEPVWKGYRASQADDNKIGEKDAEAVAPKADWLGDVLAGAFGSARVS